ncbi:MAG: hypothetical protein M1820_000456 [Bogoriella megaspora]|nr:MAG: hypothetical protein M1820_000456 [Bogoriella megaspora]
MPLDSSSNSQRPPRRALSSDSSTIPDPDKLRQLNRSPHPYLYHNHELRARLGKEAAEDTTNVSSGVESSEQQVNPDNGVGDGSQRSTYIDHDGRTRRRGMVRSAAGSESGTEADDESAVFIKALPAPRTRPRKGLRGASQDDVGERLEELDALMTPAFIAKEVEGKEQGYFSTDRERAKSSERKEEVKRAWEEFQRKRRRELFRRVSETGLLVGIGIVVLIGDGVWNKAWNWHRAELIAYIAIFVTLCAAYPFRLVKYSLQRALEEGGPRRYKIRVPSSFDPATLLYPAFLPVLVALSLSPGSEDHVLPNIILGLSALPTRLIPQLGERTGYDTLHWLLSAVPLFVSQWTVWPSKLFPPKPYALKVEPSDHLNPEFVACLYPLQTALIPLLRFLTTTSLLPAELQLLSIALMNLGLFAKSPQAQILFFLLLPGGLSVFLLCRHVLQWNVALARIPKWRLRRATRVVMARDSFLNALTSSLKSKGLSESTRATSHPDYMSDADEDGHLLDHSKNKRPRPKLRSVVDKAIESTDHDELAVRSAIEKPSSPSLPSEANGTLYHELNRRKRRYTMPEVKEMKPEPTKPPAKHKRRRSIAQAYLALTPSQATTHRWLYAGYTFATILLIILVPLRYFIGKYALNGYEPFGWALGYLFGNIPHVRDFVTDFALLRAWIPLAPGSTRSLDIQTIPTALENNSLTTILSSTLGPSSTRLLITSCWITVLFLGISTVLLVPMFTPIEVDTRRKIFHGTVVAILLPTLYVDPCFASLTLSLVLAVFLLLDLLRAAQVQPIAAPLARFLTPYVDGRDLRGPVVVSHMFLLIGCAIPVWLSLAGSRRLGEGAWKGWELEGRDVSLVAGVVCVGMGDAAASLVGRRFGRRKWPWTGGKSLEGSAAFAVAVTVGLIFGKFWLRAGGWEDSSLTPFMDTTEVLVKGLVAASGASLMEAVLTGGNDNVIVPIVLWLLVRGLGL